MTDKKRVFVDEVMLALNAQRAFEEKYDPDNLLRAKYGADWVKHIQNESGNSEKG